MINPLLIKLNILFSILPFSLKLICGRIEFIRSLVISYSESSLFGYIYNHVIEKTIGNIKGDILYNSLKDIGNNFEYNINEDFRRRLNKRIYTWYIDGDFLLLRFMCHRGAFREDINKKCLLCEKEDNGIEHVINNCKKLKKERNELITELNKLDIETKNKTLLKAIEYYYYNKKLSNSK